MNELSLFAGAGGGILGGKLLGWQTVCAVEIDAYCTGVLIQRQNDGILPPFPIWDDVRTFDGQPWRGIVDVVSGGFPCQPFSSASRGRKTAKDLWPQMLRIVSEVKPEFVFAENVSRKAIIKAGEDLIDLGYKTKALSLSASDLGGDHIRERFWLRAHTDNESEFRSEVNAEMERLPEFCEGVWSTESEQFRVANGVAARVDRIKALGNGQVPAVAAEAWRILSND